MDPNKPNDSADPEDAPAEDISEGKGVWTAIIVIAAVILLILLVITLFGEQRTAQEDVTLEPTAIELTQTPTQEPTQTATLEPTESDTEAPTEVPVTPVELTYTFEQDEEGWITGFADLPADYDEDLYQLESEWRELPSGLEGYGIYMQGHNRSDDLFMFLKVRVEGLQPNTTYQVVFTIDLATNIPEGMMGIGGSPGESVYVKAGVTLVEPEVIEDSDGWLRMNIDKGNQASEGEDMINLGNLANPNLDPETATGEEYAVKTLDNQRQPFEVTTDEDGVLWFIAGTDSGFEGLTTVYYDVIHIVLSK